MSSDQQKWNDIYRQRLHTDLTAVDVLLQNQHLLPATGTALDLACGLGANGLLLAEAGLNVHAWDISGVAIEQLKAEASKRALSIETQVRDVITSPPQARAYDVLVVSHFLVREMAEVLQDALRSGGLLFYQTFCRDKGAQIGPRNPDDLLKDNELLTMFPGLRVRVYREESLTGNSQQGWRNQAMLVAEKP